MNTATAEAHENETCDCELTNYGRNLDGQPQDWNAQD